MEKTKLQVKKWYWSTVIFATFKIDVWALY